MPRRLAILGVVIAAVVVAIVLIAAGGGDDHKVPAGAVAVVGGRPVSNAQFNHWFTVVSAVQAPPKGKQKPQPPKPGSPQYKQTAQQVMQFLVSDLWIEGEAAERGITASPQEIQRQFKQTKDQSFPTEKAYNTFLTKSGQTQDDIIFRVRGSVLADKIRQEVTGGSTDVSSKDVEDYYKQNEAQFSQPERRDVQIVLTKSPAKAQLALSKLKSGQSFKAVAKKYSEDPATKNQGGQLLGITKGQQETDFDTAIFSSSVNKIGGPVKTKAGYYVFNVSKVTPAAKQSLQQSQAGIRQLLISQKQQQQLDAFTQGFRKEWRGKTDCRKSLVIPDCSNGEEPSTAGVGPPALSGVGKPAALGGTSSAAAGAGAFAGAAGGAPGAPAPGVTPGASTPPALTGTGQPPALGGAATTGGPAGIPQGAVPQQGTAPQGGAPQGGAAPPGG